MVNKTSQYDKERAAKAKFESATEAFTREFFSDAANLYRQSGSNYFELGKRENAFMALYQALVARSREYPGFLDKGSSDFLAAEYLEELEEFVANFSEFEEGTEYYREKYLRQKYRHLLAESLKFEDANDLEAGSSALLELAKVVEAHPDIFAGEQYQLENVFRWRMMAEQNRATMLKRSGGSSAAIAEEYTRIAEMCEPPAGARSPFLEQVMAQQANFYAESFKHGAFSKLDKRIPSISNIKEALQNMKQALDHAQKAKGWFDQIDREKGASYTDNLRYLSYWCNIFLIRISVIDKQFDVAQEALKSALSDVGYFRKLGKEDNIFPNYYLDFADLQNENLVISASKAIVLDQDIPKGVDFLKQWLDLSKETHLGSWRFNNIYIRYLAASILAMLPFGGEKLREISDKMTTIDEILEHEFVGSASRKLVIIVKDMVKFVDGDIIQINDNVYKALFHKVCELFPIESTSRDFRIIESHRELPDPFEYLPEYFSRCFKKPENLKELSPDRMEQVYQTLLEGIRYYLCIITEFHYKRYLDFKQQGVSWLQLLPDNFETNFDQMSVDKVKSSLGQICKALGEKRFQRFLSTFDDVELLCHIIAQTNTPDQATLEELFKIIVTAVIPKTYMRFFPHVIQVLGSYTIYESKDTKVYRVGRIWKKGMPKELRLRGLGLILEEGSYYYLTPSWKRYGWESVDTRRHGFVVFKSDLYLVTVGKEVTLYQSGLKQRLLDCPSGPESWRDYEDICIEILKFLFVPPLDPPEIQSRTENGLLRRDALFPNWIEQGFWNQIGDRHNAHFILFEFKNTESLEPSHVDQVDKYLRLGEDAIGRFGMILSRKPPSQRALLTRRSWFTKNKVVILFLDDRLVIQMLELKIDREDPVRILRAQYEEFLLRYAP